MCVCASVCVCEHCVCVHVCVRVRVCVSIACARVRVRALGWAVRHRPLPHVPPRRVCGVSRAPVLSVLDTELARGWASSGTGSRCTCAWRLSPAPRACLQGASVSSAAPTELGGPNHSLCPHRGGGWCLRRGRGQPSPRGLETATFSFHLAVPPLASVSSFLLVIKTPVMWIRAHPGDPT